ncbi:MAG TPA: alkaline phosphatase family protein [Candidatus Angelobacter sp.]|jgi:hypothetical protein|nr:alkaline phosphatase family protein [Candidatus Angelobacter sp.]
MRTRAVLAAAFAAVATIPLAPTATAATSPSLEGVPAVQHVVVLVLENESFATTWSAASPAKYLNGLVAQGAFVPNYYGTGHVSLDNYIAMTSGLAGAQIAPTYSDCLGINLYTCSQDVSAAATVSGGSIADQIESAGLSWRQYADGTTQPCVHADYSQTASPDPFQGNGATPTNTGAGPDYADRHVPFLYYSNIIDDPSRCRARLRPFTDLSGDLAADRLPSYSFITPDTCNDGHDAPCSGNKGPGGLSSADAFLQRTLPTLLAYLRAHDGVMFITFDEGGSSDTSGCCTGGPGGVSGFGGQVGMLVLGAPVANGSTQTKYDHASLLRTTEDMLGISTHLGNAASATPITGIWSAAHPLDAASSGGSSPASPSPTPSGGAVAPAAIGLPDTSGPGSAGVLGAAALALLLGVPAARGLRRRRTGPA